MRHIDSNIVPGVLFGIDQEYENFAKINNTQVNIHKYLWMTIDCSLTGKLIFSMVDYIGKMLDDIP